MEKRRRNESRFRALFVMAVFMVIGVALIPVVDTAVNPRPVQGRRLIVSYSWPGAPANVVERNVTSVIEGLVSSVRDVAKTESVSRFGQGSVTVELKPEADVASARFEVSSLLRQIEGSFPEGVTYPVVEGGESSESEESKPVTLLTYRIADDMSANTLREYVRNRIEPHLSMIDGVVGVEVNGGTDLYLEITYDPQTLSRYGITSEELSEAVKVLTGGKEAAGELDDGGRRIAIWVSSGNAGRQLEKIPVAVRGGGTVYLNDLATYRYRHKDPDRYYRVDGMNTVYLNIIAESGSNLISLSDDVKSRIEELGDDFGVSPELTYDAAEKQKSELTKLVGRSLMSLLILLLLVLLTSRSRRYTIIVGITLAASVLISVVAYLMFDIRLHVFSLAGISVSLGLIIDASIVMIDHYTRYRDRGAFFGILAALLTTIGSLVLILFMPDYIRNDLADFAMVVMINLTVALVVAYFFVPPLVEAIGHKKGNGKKKRGGRMGFSRWWTGVYISYIIRMRRFRWLVVVILLLAFGLPVFALPEDWKFPYRKEVTEWLGGTLRLFAESLDSNTYSPTKPEMQLHVMAKLPLGGTARQLNEKVEVLDEFLKTQPGIKRWTTAVSARGAYIDVEFTPEALGTSLPYALESKVIGKVIDIGGADWATYGVSERGFSNSLNLTFRSHRIALSGYNYERLSRIAQSMCDTLSRNPRVADIAIKTPGHENQEDEYYVDYDRERMAAAGVTPRRLHASLRDVLSERKIGEIDDGVTQMDVTLSPSGRDSFDLWSLENSYIKVDSADVRAGALATVMKREAKNIIEKRNQEYVLHVAFNVIGSYNYTKKYVDDVIDDFRGSLPVGFGCEVATYGWYEDTGEQYWLLGIVVVIIYFLCGILFESWSRPLVIIMLIPVSFIGVFLAFWWSGVPFGTGGFASLALLCGIVVNSAIYILGEYDSISGKRALKGLTGAKKEYVRGRVRVYVRAYNRKITAVGLTVFSTVAGLVPFLFDGPEDKFWFSFAFGTISGLLFSLIPLVFVLPLFLRIPKNNP